MTSVDDEKLLNLLEQLNVTETTENKVCEDELTSTISYVVTASRVPPFRKPDMPYTTSDFEGVADNAEIQLSVISRILDSICSAKKRGQHFSPLFVRNFVVSCFLVASEYSDESWEWSSYKTACKSENVMNKLCEVCNCESVQELLTGMPPDDVDYSSIDVKSINERERKVNYLKFVLQGLSEILNKNNWKTYPALKMSYWWILQQLDRKNVEEQMAYLLPPALFIVDDWEQQNKILGLKCLHYILKNTTGSELRWYGRAAVIYDALKAVMYTREAEVLEILYPTITEVANVLESDPSNTGKLKSESIYDAILHQLLREMEHEQKLELRSVYAASLPAVLSAMGIFGIRWSKEVMDVCSDYLATFDGPKASDRINILKALQLYVRECWPQIHFHVASIMQMLVRLLYDVTNEDTALSPQIIDVVTQEVETLVKLLYLAAPKTTQELCYGLESISVHPQCQMLLKKILIITSVDK